MARTCAQTIVLYLHVKEHFVLEIKIGLAPIYQCVFWDICGTCTIIAKGTHTTLSEDIAGMGISFSVTCIYFKRLCMSLSL